MINFVLLSYKMPYLDIFINIIYYFDVTSCKYAWLDILNKV